MRWLLLLGWGSVALVQTTNGWPCQALLLRCFQKAPSGGRLAAGIDGAGEVAAMLLGARQIVAVGRQRPVGVHNAKYVGMIGVIGVRLVADTGRNGKVVEFLAFPDRSLVLKSRNSQRRCGKLRRGQPRRTSNAAQCFQCFSRV